MFQFFRKKKYNRKPRLIAWKVVNTCLFKDFKLDIMTRISWWNEDISRCSLAIRCWSDLLWAPMLSRTYSLLAVSLPFKPFIMAVILSISCLVLIKSLYMLCRRLLKCSKERIWTSRSLVKFPAMVLARTFIFCLSSWKLEENINISDKKANPDKSPTLWHHLYHITWKSYFMILDIGYKSAVWSFKVT